MRKEGWSSVLVGICEISENSAVLQRLEPHEKFHICGAMVTSELSNTPHRILNLKQQVSALLAPTSNGASNHMAEGTAEAAWL